MAESLTSKTIQALSWSLVESASVRGVRLVIGILLARLLLPEQFGLVAMLTIFVAVAQSFLDGGFGAALIQKRETTQVDTCSVFYFNIMVGVAAAGLLCLAAPRIAAFYNQPLLTPLMRALSLTIVINSFGLIQNTILIKQINFKTQTKVNLSASLLSGVVGITMALHGFGVWSLAVQQICSTLLGTIFLWFFNSWRPALIFSLGALREMFGFGSRILASSLLNTIFENMYLVVIGKLFSPIDLGFYTRASTFQELPSQTLSAMVGRVTFPVFATIQGDTAGLKRGTKKALVALALVNFPMMVGLAVIARPLVLVLLTDRWAESIPYLQLLTFLGLLYPLHVINLNLLQALGRSKLLLRLEIVKKALIVVNIAVTWRWGISGMIYGMMAMSLISYYLNCHYTGVLIGYPMREQLHDILPYLGVALLMGIVVSAAGFLRFSNDWSKLLVQIFTGILAYVVTCRLLRLTAFMEICRGGWGGLPFLRPKVAG
jgi:teichuronic acid exporter